MILGRILNFDFYPPARPHQQRIHLAPGIVSCRRRYFPSHDYCDGHEYVDDGGHGHDDDAGEIAVTFRARCG